MADLTEACRNAGYDSRQLRPIAHATASGRIAVYIGAAWQELPLGKAMNLRHQLSRAIAELHDQERAAEPTDHQAPERFDVQLRQWREGIRSAPPTPELSTARAAELERRALQAIASEVPHA